MSDVPELIHTSIPFADFILYSSLFICVPSLMLPCVPVTLPSSVARALTIIICIAGILILLTDVFPLTEGQVAQQGTCGGYSTADSINI